MAKLKLDGKEYDLPDSEEWTTGELSEAEHALGVAFGNKSQGDSMAIAFFIALRRVDKQTLPAILGDKVRRIPMAALITEEEDDDRPLGGERTDDQDGPLNSGHPPLEALG